ncbi:MAG: RIP metalloprotease RseP [Pseudomonadota bacterium]
MTIIYFIIALGLLIFVHELGHFIFAKRAGIYVEAFSLGFGPRLFGIKRGETDYRISLLPLGGYVKMRGEDASDEAAGDPRSFAAKSVWARVKVIIFGPLMNLFLCLVFMPIVFMIGRSEPVFLHETPALMGVRVGSPAAGAGFEKGDLIVSVDGKSAKSWEDVLNRVLLGPGSKLKIETMRGGERIERSVTVGEMPELKGGYVGFEPMLFMGNEATIDGIRSQGPAAAAGLKAGDKVVSFAGEPVADWIDLSARVDANRGATAPIVVMRDGGTQSFQVTPVHSEEYGRWLIGISKDRRSGVPMFVVRYGFINSIVMGTKENVKLAGLTMDVLRRLVTGKLSYKVLGGPIIIAKTSAAAAASGLSDFLYFLAFLSLQLSILNFLPIPVLDGGHLVFLGFEALFKHPLSVRIRSVADQVGFVVLISLMLLVTYNDIQNVWGIKEILKKIF